MDIACRADPGLAIAPHLNAGTDNAAFDLISLWPNLPDRYTVWYIWPDMIGRKTLALLCSKNESRR